MKRILAVFFLACVVVFSAPHTSLAASPPFAGTVLQRANLRAGPGTNYAIVGKANAGQTVQVTACNSGCTWYKLDTGRWIAAFLVGGGGGGNPDPECEYTVPDICVPPYDLAGDMDCWMISYANFRVLPPDPHFLDGDYDGWGCEWN